FPTCTQLISSSIIPCSLHNLATFTRRPGSSLYTLTTASPPVTVSGQVAASSQVFAAASSQVFAAAYRSSPASAPCSCRPLSHETLLWHHRLGHPSLPRLRDMASRTLVSGLPWSLPPLPPGPAPTCVPCVEGRQRAAPHSSEFPLTEAPLQALHMDVWGPARVRGQCHERYFLLVVDDYSRYTTVFPLRRKEGIRQTFTLPASPQQNGIAERRIGMVMDVARTSMIHAAAPHFLWLFAVQYAAHQINLQPRVSLPETTPTLRWTGKVGDASVFCVYGSRAFVRDTFADKLSSRVVPCVFLGFPPDALGWQFYHPTLRRVLSSRDVTVLPPQGVSQVDPVEPVEVAVDSGAARGAEPGRVEPRGAEPGGAESGGAEPAGAGPGGAEPRVAESEGAEPGGAEPARVEPGGAEPGGAESRGVEPAGDEPERAESGGPPGVQSWREPLSPQRLQEWYARRCSHAAGATGPAAGGASGAKAAGGAAGAGAAGAAGPGGAGAGGTGAVGGSTSVGVAGGAGATGPGGARTGGTGAAGPGGAAGVGAVVAGAVATGGAAGAGAAGGTGAGGSAGLMECREPESRPASPESRPPSPESQPESLVCTSRRVPCQRPPPVPGTHSMILRPSTAPQRVPQPSPPASSLLDSPDPDSDSLRAASPTVTRFLATVVTDPSFESTTASALIAKLVDFAAACRLDYATSLIAEFESVSVCPPSVGGECALGTDVLEDRQTDVLVTSLSPSLCLWGCVKLS
ncbi:unnamed protein product, partial [Closterium sp. NIES-53]